MNIIIITPRLSYGGAEHVAIMLANEFVKRGHQVSIISDLNITSYVLLPEIKTYSLFNKSKNKLIKWFQSFISVRQIIKQTQPHCVIGIMWACALRARIGTLGTNIPVINSLHDAFEPIEGERFSLKEYFRKFYLNRLYKYTTVLTQIDKNVINNRFSEVWVLPNPLSLQPLNALPIKKKKIIAAGRLEDWYIKGFDVLIKAWAKIAYKYPEWILEIAGQGSEEQQKLINKMAKDEQIEQQVHLLGFRTDMEKVYKDAEIFVLSSRYEGFGLVLIEAMSQGCACISTNHKGRQAEIITHNYDGLLCETNSVESLTIALDKMISNSSQRKAVQQQAIHSSKRFLPSVIIQKWEELLNHVQ
jgi:hypothetical protein